MFAKPLVQKDAALERLARRRGLLFTTRRPQPEKIELVYFPYHLFRISFSVGGEQREMVVASDGVLGDFAFLELDTLEFLEEVDGPRFKFHIGMERAKEKVLDQCQWLLVKHGFHRNRSPKLEAVTDMREFYYPYWVAYYKKRKGYDFNAVDGISLAPIGLRMRRAFLAAFSR